MRPISRHLTGTLIAGLVALLPLLGVVLGLIAAEKAVADSWLAEQDFYFPGLGILAAIAATYAVGLTVTTLVGKFFWSLLDRALDNVPAVGALYRTLKQVLGYGEGKDAMFERVVLVPGRDREAKEIGLVTKTLPPLETGGSRRLVVFVPAAPAPTSGRVVLLEESAVEPVDMSVHDALKFLVAAGALEDAPSPSTRTSPT